MSARFGRMILRQRQVVSYPGIRAIEFERAGKFFVSRIVFFALQMHPGQSAMCDRVFGLRLTDYRIQFLQGSLPVFGKAYHQFRNERSRICVWNLLRTGPNVVHRKWELGYDRISRCGR